MAGANRRSLTGQAISTSIIYRQPNGPCYGRRGRNRTRYVTIGNPRTVNSKSLYALVDVEVQVAGLSFVIVGVQVRHGSSGHESPRTTKLYDRTGDEITLDEVERITI